jgi:hypothetical protein
VCWLLSLCYAFPGRALAGIFKMVNLVSPAIQRRDWP